MVNEGDRPSSATRVKFSLELMSATMYFLDLNFVYVRLTLFQNKNTWSSALKWYVWNQKVETAESKSLSLRKLRHFLISKTCFDVTNIIVS